MLFLKVIPLILYKGSFKTEGEFKSQAVCK